MQGTPLAERGRLVRLSRESIERPPQHDPATYWRMGFTIPAIAAGYAYPRESLVESLVEALGDGANVLLAGPRGCGKSTACKHVAANWLAADRGPVYYSGTVDVVSSASHADPAEVAPESTSERALLVVEDGLRQDPGLLAELLESTIGRASVSVLVEARQGQLERFGDRPGYVDEVVAECRRVLEDDQFERIAIPSVETESVDAITTYFDDLVDADLDRGAIPRQSTSDGPKAAIGDEWLEVTHALTAESGDSDALERTVREAYDSVVEDGVLSLRSRVAFAINLCNAARIPCGDGVLYALVDGQGGDADQESVEDPVVVDDAVASLVGTVLTSGEGDHVLPPHETWSAVYVSEIVEREPDAVARELFATVVNRILDVAASPNRRTDVRDRRPGEERTQSGGDEAQSGGDEETSPRARDARSGEGCAGERGDGEGGESAGGRGDGEGGDRAGERGDGEGGESDGARGSGESVESDAGPRHSKMQVGGERDSLIADRSGNEEGASVVTTSPTSTNRSSLTVASVLTRLGEFGKQWPVLAPLFEMDDDASLAIPASCTPWTVSRFASMRGEIHRESGDLAAAAACFDEAIETVRAASPSPAQVDKASVHYHLNKAKLGRKRGEHDSAVDHLEAARVTAHERGYRAGEARALLALGAVRSKQGDIEQALEHHQASLGHFRSIDDNRMTANVLKEMGNLQFRRGDYDGANEYYDDALDVYRRLGERDGEASCLTNLGVVATYRGNFDAAREYQERSLALREQAGANAQVAATLNNLGIVERRTGNLEDALAHYERSLELKREVGDREGVASTLGNLGVVHRELGNYEEAERYDRRSLAIYEDIGAPRNQAKCLIDLARIYFEQDAYDDAEERLERALDAFEGTDDSGGVGRANLELGEVAAAKGDRRRALECYERSFEALEDSGAFEAVRAGTNAATTAADIGEPDRARDLFETARAYAIENDFADRFDDLVADLDWDPPNRGD